MLVTLVIAFFIYSVLIFQLMRGLGRLKPGNSEKMPRVSIILAARNESAQLPRCLHVLAQQKYPGPPLEIVLVNDHSTDCTGEIMTAFQARHRGVQVIHLTEPDPVPAPKKRALHHGISRSTGEILLFTDADCQPPETWVQGLVQYFTPGVGLVAGFSPLHSRKKSLWSGILELDSLAAATVAAGSIGLGFGLTCTGRNLAYSRKLYDEINGFTAISQSLSGDDDLLLQQVQRLGTTKVRYAFSPATIVPAERVYGVRHFIQQRRRHISAGKYFSRTAQAYYFVYHLANLIIFTGSFGLLFSGEWVLFSSLFSLKLLIDFLLLKKMGHRLSYLHPLKYFIGWEFYFLGLNILLGPTSFLGKIRWK